MVAETRHADAPSYVEADRDDVSRIVLVAAALITIGTIVTAVVIGLGQA